MNCFVILLVLIVCILPVAWALRSMIVGGAGIIWWLAGFGIGVLGIVAGCVWAAYEPLSPNQEDRAILVKLEYVLFCFVSTTALLWIYSALLLLRFGFWPRRPEEMAGFSVTMNEPPNSP